MWANGKERDIFVIFFQFGVRRFSIWRFFFMNQEVKWYSFLLLKKRSDVFLREKKKRKKEWYSFHGIVYFLFFYFIFYFFIYINKIVDKILDYIYIYIYFILQILLSKTFIKQTFQRINHLQTCTNIPCSNWRVVQMPISSQNF